MSFMCPVCRGGRRVAGCRSPREASSSGAPPTVSPYQDALVTEDRYSDRLDPSTYEGDDGIVGIFEVSPTEPDSLWLSERLFNRLTGVAVAYELHTLAMLRALDDDRLNRARCESLLDELAFVADRLNDPLAVGTAQAISDYVAARLRRPMWDGLITFQVSRSARPATGTNARSELSASRSASRPTCSPTVRCGTTSKNCPP